MVWRKLDRSKRRAAVKGDGVKSKVQAKLKELAKSKKSGTDVTL